MSTTALPVFPIDGTTSFAVLEDTVTLVDAGVPEPPQEPPWPGTRSMALGPFFEFFASHNIGLTDVQLIIVVHSSWHHVCALNALVRATGARVIAHRDAAGSIAGLEPSAVPGNPRMPQMPTPVARAVDDGDILSVLSGARVVSVADGHAGTMCLYSRATRALFAGDVLCVRKDGSLRGPTHMDCDPGKEPGPELLSALIDIRKLTRHRVDRLYTSHSIPEGRARVITEGAGEKISAFLAQFDRWLPEE